MFLGAKNNKNPSLVAWSARTSSIYFSFPFPKPTTEGSKKIYPNAGFLHRGLRQRNRTAIS